MYNIGNNRNHSILLAVAGIAIGTAIFLWYFLDSGSSDDLANVHPLTNESDVNSEANDIAIQNKHLREQISTLESQLKALRLQREDGRGGQEQGSVDIFLGSTGSPRFLDNMMMASHGKMMSRHLSQLLDLSPEQSRALSAMFDRQANAEMGLLDTPLAKPETHEEMMMLEEKMRQQDDAINRDYNNQIADILTPEQLVTLRNDELAKRNEMHNLEQKMQETLVLNSIDNLDDYQISEITKLFKLPPDNGEAGDENNIIQIIPQMQSTAPMTLSAKQQQNLELLLTFEQYQQFKDNYQPYF